MRVWLGVCSVLLAAIFATPAAAATTWSPPSTLTALPFSSVSPAVAMGSGSDAIVAWYGSHYSAGQDGYRVAVRRNGTFAPSFLVDSGFGSHSAPQPGAAMNASGLGAVVWLKGSKLYASIVDRGETTGNNELVGEAEAMHPDQEVFVDDAGTVTVLWNDGTSVLAAVRPADGRFGPVQKIRSPHRDYLSNPRYAVAPNGNAIVVFGTYKDAYVATRSGRTENFSAPTSLGPASGTTGVAAPVINNSGQAGVFWGDSLPQGGSILYFQHRKGTAPWSAPEQLDDTNLGGGATAIAPDGRIAIIYTQRPNGGTTQLGSARIWTPGKGWGAFESMSDTAPMEYETPLASFAADGTLWVAWRFYHEWRTYPPAPYPYDATVYGAARTISGQWTTEQVSRTEGNVWPLALATSHTNGQATIAYPQDNRDTSFVIHQSTGTPPPTAPTGPADPTPTDPNPPQPGAPDPPSGPADPAPEDSASSPTPTDSTHPTATADIQPAQPTPPATAPTEAAQAGGTRDAKPQRRQPLATQLRRSIRDLRAGRTITLRHNAYARPHTVTAYGRRGPRGRWLRLMRTTLRTNATSTRISSNPQLRAKLRRLGHPAQIRTSLKPSSGTNS